MLNMSFSLGIPRLIAVEELADEREDEHLLIVTKRTLTFKRSSLNLFVIYYQFLFRRCWLFIRVRNPNAPIFTQFQVILQVASLGNTRT